MIYGDAGRLSGPVVVINHVPNGRRTDLPNGVIVYARREAAVMVAVDGLLEELRPVSMLPKTKHVGDPMLDFPTAWRIVRRGLIHTTWRCSYVQSNGAFLCDCPALEREWLRMIQTGRLLSSATGRPL